MSRLPDAVETASRKLTDGSKSGIADAHSALQSAVPGAPGCLRTDPPLEVDWADATWGALIGL